MFPAPFKKPFASNYLYIILTVVSVQFSYSLNIPRETNNKFDEKLDVIPKLLTKLSSHGHGNDLDSSSDKIAMKLIPTYENDHRALLALNNSFGSLAGSWPDLNGDHCSWYGVICESGIVTKIDFWNAGLEGNFNFIGKSGEMWTHYHFIDI